MYLQMDTERFVDRVILYIEAQRIRCSLSFLYELVSDAYEFASGALQRLDLGV